MVTQFNDHLFTEMMVYSKEIETSASVKDWCMSPHGIAGELKFTKFGE